MSWRTVYITNQAHLSFKNNYLVIRSDEVKQIHLSEINTLIIDNNLSSISIYLINELIKFKIKVIICNEQHNPNLELMSYNSSFEASKIIAKETNWDKEMCGKLWKTIITYKIKYQSKLLKECNLDSQKLDNYINEIEVDDATNREGHAAKVYFNKLFGNKFSRDDDSNNINSYLNYGYTIILSSFNRALSKHGYIAQIGIHHKGPTNPFNLSCDLMEPFRPIVDKIAINNVDNEFNKDKKIELINLLNKKFIYKDKRIYLSELIDNYVLNLLSCFDKKEIKEEWFDYAEE